MPVCVIRGAAPRRIQNLTILLALSCSAAAAFAQDSTSTAPAKKALTWQAVFGPDKVDFNGSVASGMSWTGDGRTFFHRRDGKLLRVDAQTDAGEPAYDAEAMASALRAGGFDEKSAERNSRSLGQLSKDRSVTLIQEDGKLYVYRFSDHKLRRVADKGERDQIALSPAGGYVSFVKGNNIYVIDADGGGARRRTRDGSATVLNGVLDWVYQEEIYGRFNFRGYWWRDDDKYIAYLQLGEEKVPTYTVIDTTPTHPTPEVMRYPKAGDPNPTVKVGIVKPGLGRAWADLSAYKNQEILIAGVSWAPDGKLILMVQDREQRWLDLLEVDPSNGRSKVLLKETSPAWVDNIGAPEWQKDGSFLWLSERDGYCHIYHYARDGHMLGRVTEGEWTVSNLTARSMRPVGGLLHRHATR